MMNSKGSKSRISADKQRSSNIKMKSSRLPPRMKKTKEIYCMMNKIAIHVTQMKFSNQNSTTFSF